MGVTYVKSHDPRSHYYGGIFFSLAWPSCKDHGTWILLSGESRESNEQMELGGSEKDQVGTRHAGS